MNSFYVFNYLKIIVISEFVEYGIFCWVIVLFLFVKQWIGKCEFQNIKCMCVCEMVKLYWFLWKSLTCLVYCDWIYKLSLFILIIVLLKRKLFVITSCVICVIAVCFVGNATQQKTSNDLMIQNVEALSTEETSTTWNCINNTGNCHASCGVCGTSVSGKGDLIGTHRCSWNY